MCSSLEATFNAGRRYAGAGADLARTEAGRGCNGVFAGGGSARSAPGKPILRRGAAAAVIFARTTGGLYSFCERLARLEVVKGTTVLRAKLDESSYCCRSFATVMPARLRSTIGEVSLVGVDGLDGMKSCL